MITIFFYILFAIEARVDYYVCMAQIKNDSIKEYDRLWHRWKFGMWAMMMLFIFLSTGSIFTIVAAAVVRLLVMQIEYNDVRGLPLQHLGTNAIDATCNKLMGDTGTLTVKIILFKITLFYEITHYDTTAKEVFRILLSH